MSLPNIPDITPEISLNRCEAINLLLSSIALEEVGLSHFLNAEGEKLQKILNKHECDMKDLIKINRSVNQTLKAILNSQLILLLKLENVLEITQQHQCQHKQTDGHRKVCCSSCQHPCEQNHPCQCYDSYGSP